MNKKITVLSTFFMLVVQILTFAQKNNKWNVGISSGWGKDYFHKRYTPYSQVAPGALFHVNSKRSFDVGIVAERFVSSNFSIYGTADYLISQMPSGQLFDENFQGYYTKNERHHWATIGAGLRTYLSKVQRPRLFFETGLLAGYFIGYSQFTGEYGKQFFHHAQDFGRFIPSANLGIGIQAYRFQIKAIYNVSVARTMAYNYTKYLYDPAILKQTISRQAFSLNATVLLIKAEKKSLL